MAENTPVKLGLYIVTEKRIAEEDLRASLSGLMKCELPTPWYRLSYGNDYRMYFWNLIIKDVRDFRQKLLKYQHKHKKFGVLVITEDVKRTMHKCC